MKRCSDSFALEVPDDWVESRQRKAFVYEGPMGEILMVSSNVVQGPPGEDRGAFLGRLAEGAPETIRRSAVEGGLTVLKPISEEMEVQHLKAWSVISGCEDDQTLFCQLVVAGDFAVLLLTLETEHGPEGIATFRRIVRSVRSVA